MSGRDIDRPLTWARPGCGSTPGRLITTELEAEARSSTMTSTEITADAVRDALSHARTVAERASFSVAPQDFTVWLEAVGAVEFDANAWTGEGGGVHAHIGGYHHGMYYQVHTVASDIDGYEVPDADAEDRFVKLPASAAACLRERVTA